MQHGKGGVMPNYRVYRKSQILQINNLEPKPQCDNSGLRQ